MEHSVNGNTITALFSGRVSMRGRTHFIDTRQNTHGRYVTITESRLNSSGDPQRSRVLIPVESVDEFVNCLRDAVYAAKTGQYTGSEKRA